MDPEEAIAALDEMLAQEEVVTLRRVIGVDRNAINVDVRCPAKVAAFRPEQLVGGINQTDSHVIISPTPIRQSGWPGGHVTPAGVDAQTPLADGATKCVVQGRVRNVAFVNSVKLAGQLVRIEMTVSG